MKVFTKKDKLVLLYSNDGKPFVHFYFYSSGKLVEEVQMDLEDYQIEQGCIVNFEPIVKDLLSKYSCIPSIDLVFSIKEIFKSVNSFPKMNKAKAVLLARQELKNEFPDWKTRFIPIQFEYKYSLGFAFFTYFIDSTIVNSFKKLAQMLNTKIKSINLYGNWLAGLINAKNLDNYAGIFIKNKCLTLITVLDQTLVSCYSHKVNDSKDLLRLFSIEVGGHEMEFERKLIPYYLLETDDPEFNVQIDFLTKVECHISFNEYLFNGKKI